MWIKFSVGMKRLLLLPFLYNILYIRVVKSYCVKQKKRQNVLSLRVIKQPKMVELRFGALDMC